MARVYVSSVISAEAGNVWARIRDFNALAKWHPRIRDSRIEDALPADKIGCIRSIHLQNGDMIREQLVALSDYDLFYSYTMLEGPMPLSDYMATLRLTPVTDGARTFAEWSAEFSCDPANETDLTNTLGSSVFQGGFDALKRHFGG
ncbi:SRPBCC family protein [Rhizobium leguminosarum]|uniref:SRPBCC family protein n=1 Tax=Rhizobium leguminosarum TaxID=384 RepID=UPI0013BF44A7|nr:SRPBCC family protein [Rhizobium leguminosarum]NEH97726.1 SRPBCC family protein [Rhizobium leguminosarum]NEJ44465.1 SRPBCC family protein [Rhizobium leguminosarum]NEJ54138.1 SRPBCC family protein [Rhizobium leguminosarum]NEJ82409.1 SRPBCC family protein [Rhizobium leguminosarum]